MSDCGHSQHTAPPTPPPPSTTTTTTATLPGDPLRLDACSTPRANYCTFSFNFLTIEPCTLVSHSSHYCPCILCRFSLQLKIALSHVHILYNRYRVRLEVYLLYWLASSTLNLTRLSCMHCGQSLVCDSFMLCLISDHDTCNRVSFMLCVPWQEAISNCSVLVRDQ